MGTVPKVNLGLAAVECRFLIGLSSDGESGLLPRFHEELLKQQMQRLMRAKSAASKPVMGNSTDVLSEEKAALQ